MKRMTNAALSFALALVLLLQLAGPAAYADDPSAVTGQEPIGYEAWLLTPTESDPKAELQITEANRAELLGEKSFSLKLGEQELPAAADSTVRLDSLKEEDHDLIITPPDGYRVSILDLLADTDRTMKCALPSHLSAADSTALTVKGQDLLDKDGKYDAKLFKDFKADSFSKLILRVQFAPIDETAEVTVSYDLKGVVEDLDDEKLQPEQSHTAATLDETQKAAAEAAGKSFVGWILRYDNGAAVAVSPGTVIKPYADCTLEAQWKSILTVTANAPVQQGEGFIANGCTVSGNLAEGDSLANSDVELQLLNENGQLFVRPSAAKIKNAHGAEVSARYDIRYADSPRVSHASAKVTVRFEMQGHGAAPENQEIERGATATKPTDPTADDWSFGGWFTDSACTQSFDFTTPVTEDLPLYAKWTEAAAPAAKRTLRYMDGETELFTQEVEDGKAATAPSDPEKTGVFFDGWYADSACSQPFDFAAPITADTRVYAKWSTETYTLTVQAVSAEKNYDGTPLEASAISSEGYTNGYKITGLAEGHTISGLKVTVSGSVTLPKDSPIETEPVIDKTQLKISDRQGRDVTARYTISAIKGALTVKKQTLTITPISAEVEYAGEAIKASAQSKEGFTKGCKVEGLPAGHMPSEITVLGEGTDVGEYPTSIKDPSEIQVSKGSENVSDCFTLEIKSGTLTIKPRPVTVSAVTATLTVESITNPIQAKNIRGGDGYDYGFKAEGLLAGDSAKGDFVIGSTSEPGEFKSDIDKAKVKIVDKDNKDVTKNYEISTKSGKVTLRLKADGKTSITVTATASKVYDAKPLTIANSHIRVTQGALPANYKLEADFGPTTSITDVQKVSVSLSNVKIKDDKGKDVTDQYQITTVSGTMEVTRMPLTLTAESASKTYDGKALVNRNVRATALASKNHDLSVEYEILNSEGKVIKNGAVNVGTYTKRISSVTIKEGSKDVTNNYAIARVEGKLTINAASGNAKNNAKSPRTGDERNALLWLSILLASAVLLCLMFVMLVRKGKLKLSRGPKEPRSPRKPKG